MIEISQAIQDALISNWPMLSGSTKMENLSAIRFARQVG